MIPWPSWFSAWVVFLPIVSPESPWVQTPLGARIFFILFFLSQKVYLIAVSYQKMLFKHYSDIIQILLKCEMKWNWIIIDIGDLNELIKYIKNIINRLSNYNWNLTKTMSNTLFCMKKEKKFFCPLQGLNPRPPLSSLKSGLFLVTLR